MSGHSRFPAIVAYLFPVIGWLYVFAFQRENKLAMFHLRQVIGLVLFLAGAIAGWAVVAWVVAWFPYMSALSVGLFTLVMAAFFFGILAWILGLINALGKRVVPLPGFGRWAERLPIH